MGPLQALRLEARLPQAGKEIGEPFRPVAEAEPPAVFQQPRRAAGKPCEAVPAFMPGQAASGRNGCPAAGGGEIRRIADHPIESARLK